MANAEASAVLAVSNAVFDYSGIDARAAQRVRNAADRIRERVKTSIEDIIEVGCGLLSVKEILPHGRFGEWLRAEFGWTDRTAQNFMAVAEQFGSKSEIISDLRIQPTAAYLLAAPSVPEDARQAAISRAEAGETITSMIAKRIVMDARKKDTRSVLDETHLALLLVRSMERFRSRWNPDDMASLARRFREFADTVDAESKKSARKTSSRKGGKRSSRS